MKKVIFGCCAIVALAAFTLAPQAKPEKNEIFKLQVKGADLFAVLSGANEVDRLGNPGVGDPDGSGTAEIYINQGQGTLTYVITVNGIATATAAHIHEAPANMNGPIVVGIMERIEPPSSGVSSGVVIISKELAKEIRKNPQDYYVNIHNAEFKAGAIRGQLSN